MRFSHFIFILFFSGTCIAQITPPIQYPTPGQNFYEYEPELSDHWAFNSSHVYSPLTAGYGYFNYHKKGGDIGSRNIQLLSFEMVFPVVINRRFERDEIVRYDQFLPTGTFVDGKEVDFKGYQISAMGMFDALGWKWITLGANYGFSFGNRKMVSFVSGKKFKVKNPFVGLLGGIDLRFNVGRTAGLSFGGYANYMLDISKDRWINKQQYVYTLPQRTKFSGWQVGVTIGFILFDEQ